MLDGVISEDGVVTVMTTNHIKKLDEALLRGGRIDRRFAFAFPDEDQVEQFFFRFYPDAPETTGKRFAKKVFERSEKYARSIATLQQHFILTRKKNAEQCVDALDDFFNAYFPQDIDDPAAS